MWGGSVVRLGEESLVIAIWFISLDEKTVRPLKYGNLPIVHSLNSCWPKLSFLGSLLIIRSSLTENRL